MFRLNGAPPGQSGGVNQVWLDRSGRDLATGMLGEYLGGGSVGQNWESLNSLCHGYCWKTSVIGVWAAWLAPGCSVDPESAFKVCNSVFQVGPSCAERCSYFPDFSLHMWGEEGKEKRKEKW